MLLNENRATRSLCFYLERMKQSAKVLEQHTFLHSRLQTHTQLSQTISTIYHVYQLSKEDTNYNYSTPPLLTHAILANINNILISNIGKQNLHVGRYIIRLNTEREKRTAIYVANIQQFTFGPWVNNILFFSDFHKTNTLKMSTEYRLQIRKEKVKQKTHCFLTSLDFDEFWTVWKM